MTVYGVTSGSYSDYRVLCICPTKQDAEAVAAKIRGQEGHYNDANVEAFYEANALTVPTFVLSISCNVWDDGTVTPIMERTDVCYPWDYNYRIVPVSWRWVRAPMHKNIGGRLEVSGTNATKVRRVYSDRKAQLLAEDAFRLRKEAKG